LVAALGGADEATSAAAKALAGVVSVAFAEAPKSQLAVTFALLEETRALRSELLSGAVEASVSQICSPEPIRIGAD
jgi:hypothetical protein